MVNFAQEIYDAFELDRSVEVCLTKSADTAIPVIISLVPMETANPPDDAVPALGICLYVHIARCMLEIVCCFAIIIIIILFYIIISSNYRF